MTNTSAESFWEEGTDDEVECERFLQAQKTKIIEDEEEVASAEDYEEEDDDEEDEEEENSEDIQDEAAAEESDQQDAEDSDDDADVEDSDDDSAPAAEADEDADAATTVKEPKMAKTKAKTGGKTKAEAIREVIERRKKAGDSLRPRDIIEELSENGFEVNASQVSVTLRSMGVPPAPKGRVKGSKLKPAATPTPEAKSRMALKRGVGEKGAGKSKSDDALAVEVLHPGDPAAMVDLAVEFIQEVGGYDQAMSLLHSIARARG